MRRETWTHNEDGDLHFGRFLLLAFLVLIVSSQIIMEFVPFGGQRLEFGQVASKTNMTYNGMATTEVRYYEHDGMVTFKDLWTQQWLTLPRDQVNIYKYPRHWWQRMFYDITPPKEGK